MKKISLLLVLTLMLFSFAGCANDDETGAENNEPGTTNVEPGDEDGKTGDIEGEEPGDLDKDKESGDLDKDEESSDVDTELDSSGETKTLTGKAKGYGGDVTVTVTVDGDDITDVKAVGNDETEGVGSNAIDQLPDLIAEADSTDVDGVSGATMTSNAIKEAVSSALANE